MFAVCAFFDLELDHVSPRNCYGLQ